MDPKIIVADEPVSALDVSVQSQVLDLFIDLQQRLGLTYVFISHDLSVIRYLCDRVAVMYLGRIVEQATAEELFTDPAAPVHEGPARGRAPDRGRARRSAGGSSPASCPARATSRPAAAITRAARS